MARVAVVEASPGSVTALRAAAGAEHDVVCCGAGQVPADAALLVVDAGSAAPRLAELSRLASGRPALVLIDRQVRVDAERVGNIQFVRKPCEILTLRSLFRAMLEQPACDPAPAALASPWLEAPWIPAAAANLLAAAQRLGRTVWIAGEPGSGADRAAAALARAWDDGRAPVVWQDDERVDEAWARLADAARVLWAPAVDARCGAQQMALERWLALDGNRRVVVTSSDDPAGAELAPALHRALAAVALRLPPLRERRGEIATLATAIGASVAARLGDGARFVIADSARASLENYDWPGNQTELEAVVTRSALARGVGRDGIVELAEADLRYAPDFASASLPRSAEPATPRRAVVVPLGAARALESASDKAGQPSVEAGVLASPAPAGPGVEALLAAFAHEIRNPMVTLKTFTTLAAAGADDGSAELARLATGAAERIDAQLDCLQRYTELAGAGAAALRVDAIDVLGEAADAGGSGLQVAARSPLWVQADPEVVRFVADALVAESRERAGAAADEGEATADLAADKQSIELNIPAGGLAVDRLGKWVEGRGLPWRLALARDLARRGGGDLGIDEDDGAIRVRWTPGPVAEAEEVERDGGEARSADRRRRGRSS